LELRNKLLDRLLKPPVTPVQFDGVDCFIRHWSEKEKISWAEFCLSVKESDGDKISDNYIRCRALTRSLCDADGKLIFDSDEHEKVAEFPSTEVARVFDLVIGVQSEPTDSAKKN
jgi:hypothetical protein